MREAFLNGPAPPGDPCQFFQRRASGGKDQVGRDLLWVGTRRRKSTKRCHSLGSKGWLMGRAAQSKTRGPLAPAPTLTLFHAVGGTWALRVLTRFWL